MHRWPQTAYRRLVRRLMIRRSSSPMYYAPRGMRSFDIACTCYQTADNLSSVCYVNGNRKPTVPLGEQQVRRTSTRSVNQALERRARAFPSVHLCRSVSRDMRHGVMSKGRSAVELVKCNAVGTISCDSVFCRSWVLSSVVAFDSGR